MNKNFSGFTGGGMMKKVLTGMIIFFFLLGLSAVGAFAGKTVSPTVKILEPTNGATVSGKAVRIAAYCTSGDSKTKITSVTYQIDNGAKVQMSGPNGSTQGTWEAYWDSTTVSNGQHSITVEAINSANQKKSQTITVNVSNSSGGGSNLHANLLWSEYPDNCYSCHATKFQEVYGSVHYQWQGNAPDMVNKPDILQGKISNSVNAYCINILGNWGLCGKCHIGRGSMPVYTSNPTYNQLMNIDCLVCHSESYALVRTRRSDGTMGPPEGTDEATLNSYVRNIHLPKRTNCLKCHAYAGGGDAVKRGDLAWATANTTDRNYDVHMATTSANLVCQDCHTFVNHRVTGKGSDLRPTDYASEVNCGKSGCHPEKATSTGHSNAYINRHVNRVACQTCHIPYYGRDAADTPDSEATEIHRDWTDTSHHGTTPPYHPGSIKANNVLPKYQWWNRLSDNYLLYDVAKYDSNLGAYIIQRPVGSVDGPLPNKLYPFKYKTAKQPMRTASKQLIALDTKEYILTSGDPDLATQKGLLNMGFSSTDAYEWVITGTFQLLNHQVAPKENALSCNDCHQNTSRMDLIGQLGYKAKADLSVVCSQCHRAKSYRGFVAIHDRHVKDKKFDCSWCHNFSRPERNLITP